MADHFLTKTTIDMRHCLEYGDGLAIDAYAELHELLLGRCGEDSAQLFAEPLLSRGNDQVAPSISWYTDITGTGQPFGRLDSAQQADLTAELTRRLEPLRALLDDADHGALVAASLNVTDMNAVWAIEGRPVIINWGMLPEGVAHDPDSRAAHYAQTLGAFLPLTGAPPFEAEGRGTAAKAGMVGAAAATAALAGSAAQAGTGSRADEAALQSSSNESAMNAPNTPTPPPPPEPPVESTPARVPLWAWLPLLLLLVIAGGTLIWLLIPGNRLFPDSASNAAIPDDAARAAALETNRALEARLAELQAALDGAMCVDDGTLLMPDGRTIEGLLPPNPNDRTDIPGAVRPANRTAILPPDPERVRVPDGANPQDTRALLAHIEERTAFVLAPSPEGLGSGTGFFVGPDLLVTNYHVIEGAGAQGIFVTNKDLGTVHQAQVLKSLGPFESTGGDFALLRVPGVQQPAFTVLQSAETLRLQSVIAAGYPGDVLQSDAQFQRLRSGDGAAVPELAVTDGTVSAEQQFSETTHVVVHSAPISQGNSGGPLIDMCGRLVGVNTFVKRGALRNLNFALSTDDLVRFLSDTGAVPQVVSQACNPQVQRPMAPPAAAAATLDVPVPAPAPNTGGAGTLPQLPALTPRSE